MPATLRSASVSDAVAICELTSQLGYDVNGAALSSRLERILARSDQLVLIAEIDGRAVGWVHGEVSEYVEAESFVRIGGLVVDRSHRKQGIGRLLMEAIEAWAERQGCSIVRLSSSSTRTAAHRFYERIGYTNLKAQYAFVKALDDRLLDRTKFVPRVDIE